MTDSDKGPVGLDDPIFLGRAVERLSDLIAEQCETMLRDQGVTIPVKSYSLVSVLAQLGSGTAADLSRQLDVSHQLVLQKIPKLVKLGLITSARDGDDARKKMFSLTREGERQWEKFQHCRNLIRQAYDGLFAEVGNVMDVISKASAALHRQPLGERITKRP